MAEAKFNLFSKNLVQYLVVSIDKLPRLSRNGIPTYETLEEMASNTTMPIYLNLTERQKQDYEALRTNLRGLLKQYREKKEKFAAGLSDREFGIYEKLNFWLREYELNSNLKATRGKKPDF
jgi:hypothetical protein